MSAAAWVFAGGTGAIVLWLVCAVVEQKLNDYENRLVQHWDSRELCPTCDALGKKCPTCVDEDVDA